MYYKLQVSKFWLEKLVYIFFSHCVSQLSTAVQEEPGGGAGQRNTNEAYYSTATMLVFLEFLSKNYLRQTSILSTNE